ncbi:SRPBCC domain-containing protein [Pinirhizobacter soli]|uniref:SRPBCC domain-containing protein n=1 Tax=Pinirhizobacter soli TaxID=2786953 RepID=UPI002029DFB4|nr:SRPBCC domain-containing protein [Pinirhizobacter soli]
MLEPAVIHDTFVLERTYPASVERVFAFLSDPAKKRQWYARSEASAEASFEMDFREGGIERSSYRMDERTPFPGEVLANEGTYQDIEPGERVVLATSMTLAGRRISCSLITVELAGSDGGTKMTLTHQAAFFEGSGGPEMRKGGWEQLLNRFDEALAG